MKFDMLAALVAAAIAAPAPGQVAGVRAIEPNKEVATPAGKSVVSYFSFAGIPGQQLVFVAGGKGALRIAAFGPGGEELMSASGAAGAGEVRLKLIPSFLDSYLLSVIREKPQIPFTLRMVAVHQPTFAEASMAWATGYRLDEEDLRCWIVPGVTRRLVQPDGKVDHSLLSDRATVHVNSISDGKAAERDVKYSLQGDEYVLSYKYPDGRTRETRAPIEPAQFRSSDKYKYESYLCDGVDSAKP